MLRRNDTILLEKTRVYMFGVVARRTTLERFLYAGETTTTKTVLESKSRMKSVMGSPFMI